MEKLDPDRVISLAELAMWSEKRKEDETDGVAVVLVSVDELDAIDGVLLLI
jgi:hypothetical protein